MIMHVPEANLPGGWLDVTHGRQQISLPRYLVVRHLGVYRTPQGEWRDRVEVREGFYKGEIVTVRRRSQNESWFRRGMPPRTGAAHVTYDRRNEELRYGSSGPVAAITFDERPVPLGSHTLAIPSYPHRQGEPYVNRSQYAKIWFLIGTGRDHFLHCGTRTDGCVTVTDFAEWDRIYDYLIRCRMNDQHVGRIRVFEGEQRRSPL